MRETWRGGSFTGDPESYVEKALEMGISLHRAPTGEPGRGLIYQRWMKGALETEYLSLREYCEGNLGGWGSFTGDLGRCVKEGSGDRHLSP